MSDQLSILVIQTNKHKQIGQILKERVAPYHKLLEFSLKREKLLLKTKSHKKRIRGRGC